ncbi:MAG: iron-sulfur cluster insertion protein ErpA [Nanoarchaeota archaeon]|nr:iron-sulfur cluster insertion protein ErpA [Nanoarchaeota archaeon]
METQLEQKINKDMVIGDIVQKYPEVAEQLGKEGIHCVGCGAATHETIEQGLMGHGATPELIEQVVIRLNEAVKDSKPREEFKSTSTEDTVNITQGAADKVKELIEKQEEDYIGLRISVMAGGCSGLQYGFEFAQEKSDDDRVFDIKGTKFFIDPESFEMIKGSKIEYVDALQGAGFKISNPNATQSCGCGKSFN